MFQDPHPTESPRLQCTSFLSSLFAQDDLVEVRAIRNREDGSTEVVERDWRRAFTTSILYNHFRELNQQGANIYFGVNPRTGRDGNKQSVKQCRSVWVDMDQITVEDAENRWKGLLPPPSLVVSSGHGVHLYWMLQEPWSVASPEERHRFEGMLKCLYADLGADSTQDVCRLLRLPGFDNVKGDSVPCRLVRSGYARVSIDVFTPWFSKAAKHDRGPTASSSPFDGIHLVSGHKKSQQIRSLLSRLDEPATDRSRRDFGVVCGLFRLGLSAIEIHALVEDHSKFTTRSYTETTIRNAMNLSCRARSDRPAALLQRNRQNRANR